MKPQIQATDSGPRSNTLDRPIAARGSATKLIFPASTLLFGIAAIAVFAAGNSLGGSLVTLIGITFSGILKYRENAGFGGSLALIVSAISLIYAIGIAPREYAVFGINPSTSTLLVIAFGTLTLFVSCLVFSVLSRSKSPNVEADTRETHGAVRILQPVLLIAVLAGLINYATGDIPLLSGDINGSRLNGSYGALGRLWPIILPVLQSGVIVGALLIARRQSTKYLNALALAASLILLLNGGRSLFVICAIAIAVVMLDVYRPRLWIVLGATAVGAAVFGLVGLLRADGSSNRDATAIFLSERNLDSWWGSLDLSLQTGPRVFDLATAAAENKNLMGQILFGDLGNLFDSTITRSDRLVTLAIGRDPAVVGGMPPTLWGGFYLDFGLIGVIIGAVLLAGILIMLRQRFMHSRSIQAGLIYGYFAAYVTIGVYSYASFRPSWIVVALLATAMHLASRPDVRTSRKSVRGSATRVRRNELS